MSVSVIIPNYNNAEFIEQCVRSVADDPAVSEIVLYDDCSTDGSADIAEALAIEKLKVVRGRENLGIALARHAAIEASTNELLCFLDGDDYLAKGSVRAGHDALTNSNADMALFTLVGVNAADTEVLSRLPPPPKPISGREAFELTLGGWDIHTLGVLRRSVYDAAMRRFTPHGWSDGEVLMRDVLLVSKRICGSSGTYFYRRVPRPFTPEKIDGLTRTRLRALDTAAREGISGPRLRRERNMAVRNLVGAMYKAATGRMPMRAARALLAEYPRSLAGWGVDDLRYLPAAIIVRTAAYASRLLGPAT
jgi:glycosyltransferase involved in cell wall biosynthesis